MDMPRDGGAGTSNTGGSTVFIILLDFHVNFMYNDKIIINYF